jgi:hypothetical protein
VAFAACYICNEFIHRFVPSALSKIRVTDEIKNISKLDLTTSVDGSALILNWTGRQFFKSDILRLSFFAPYETSLAINHSMYSHDYGAGRDSVFNL